MILTLPLDLGDSAERAPTELGEGAVHLPNFAKPLEAALLAQIEMLTQEAPFRRMSTRGGHVMSVALTNCGPLGWVSDQSGYRYSEHDPLTAKPWPLMPRIFAELAQRAALAAGFRRFEPDACLVNCYEPGSKMSLHQDRDELDKRQPIVSVSLGVSAQFLWGGSERNSPTRTITLSSGDVVIFGGASRLNFHGIKRLAVQSHPLTAERRYNLTFRRAR
jgi:alkylated DNA repair protein (DNA oxidative demethylase)